MKKDKTDYISSQFKYIYMHNASIQKKMKRNIHT